jgi:hypothetical protein
MCFRKGSRRHVLAGRIFVASMLTMGAFAVYLAITRNQPNNIGGGIFTFYLVGTAWLTARRREGETSRFDWLTLLVPLALGILSWMGGIKTVRSGASSQDGVPVGMTFFLGTVMLLAAVGDVRMLVRSGASSQDGVPVGMTFFLGSVMLLAAVGDVRMLVRGGVFGAKRIARHLWRMCFGLFIASGSFFFGGGNRPLRLLSAVGIGQHLPRALFTMGVYMVLTILPLVLLVFWLIRVRFTKAYNGKSMIPGSVAGFVEQKPAS